MNALQEFREALSLQVKAFSFIKTNNLSWTFLIPIALFLLLLTIGLYSIGELTEYLTMKVLYNYVYDGLVSSILLILFRILFFIVVGMWGGYIIVIIMSPFLAYISEKTEKIITGNDYPFNLSQFVNDVIRGILLVLRNFCMEMLIGFVFFLCSFFTAAMAAPFFSIILFFVSAYFYGFSFIDYTNERRKLSVKQSVHYVGQRKAMSCGHGFVFALLLYIPVLGVALSAFYAIIATVAATMHVLEKDTEETPQNLS